MHGERESLVHAGVVEVVLSTMAGEQVVHHRLGDRGHIWWSRRAQREEGVSASDATRV